MQLSTLTINCTNEIFHNKSSLFEYFKVENLICASVNYDLKFHKCGNSLQNTSFCAFYKWKISFVQVPTLTINCTNAITHRKTRLFDCFTVKQPICATVKSDFKSHKCKISQQNGYFCVFCRGKPDLCKCQL